MLQRCRLCETRNCTLPAKGHNRDPGVDVRQRIEPYGLCLSLLDLLSPFNITRINFFSLDIEGGELSILKTIDFEWITFDVILVETARLSDSANEKKEYMGQVKDLLISKGYIYWDQRGRNSWFTNIEFKPFRKDLSP